MRARKKGQTLHVKDGTSSGRSAKQFKTATPRPWEGHLLRLSRDEQGQISGSDCKDVHDGRLFSANMGPKLMMFMLISGSTSFFLLLPLLLHPPIKVDDSWHDPTRKRKAPKREKRPSRPRRLCLRVGTRTLSMTGLMAARVCGSHTMTIMSSERLQTQWLVTGVGLGH